MGIAERRERQKAEVRELILKAAREIALDEGLDALSMRRIAEKIEYAPSTIYLHFENRDEIAEQLCKEGFQELLGFFRPTTEIADPQERLNAIARAYVAFGLERPESYRIIFMLHPKYAAAVLPKGDAVGADPENPGDQAFMLVQDTVAELVESGRFRPIDPSLAAQMMWASVHGIVSLRLTCPDFPFADPKTLTEAMIEMIQHGCAT